MNPRITYAKDGDATTRQPNEAELNRYRWVSGNVAGTVLKSHHQTRSSPARWVARRDGGRWCAGSTRAEATTKALRD